MNTDILKSDMPNEESNKNQAPIFIVGCGRSGTTLLRTMMNHHRDIAIPLESLFIVDYLRAGIRCDLKTVKELTLREYEIQEWGISVTGKDIDNLSTVVEIIYFLHNMYAEIQGKTRWGQKTPRFVRHGALLLKYFPEAIFIHIIRDPRAVVSSFLNSKAHLSNILFASKRWAMDVQAGLNLKKNFPEKVLEIRYEKLVSDTKNELRNICRFMQIPFDENMLRYYEKGNSEYSRYYDSLHHKLDKKPDTESIDAWQNKLSQHQQCLVEEICSPLMQGLGYKTRTSAKSSRAYINILKFQRLFGICRQIIHYLLYRRGYISSFLRRKYKLRLLLRDFIEINYRI